MLSRLCISNYELIDHIDHNFHSGLNVITGETGTGKSMILSALNLLLGGRGSDKVLKDKSKKCVLEASIIANDNSKSLFDENELDWDERMIIRREFTPQGRSRSFINDTPVNLDVLKKIASRFIDIHSQDQTNNINNAEYQLELLDIYSNAEKTLIDYQSIYKKYEQLSDEIIKKKEKAKKDKEEQDFIQFQFNELYTASLIDGEIEELTDERELLNKQEDIKDALEKGNFFFSEKEQNILELLYSLQQHYSPLKDVSPWLNEINRRINELYAEVKDLNFELESRKDDQEMNPARISDIEERLHTYYTLENKFKVSGYSELLKIMKSFESRLRSIEGSDDTIIALEEELNQIHSKLIKKGEELSKKRKSKAQAFANDIASRLKLLGIEHPSSVFEIKPLKSPSFYGLDEVDFLFSSNKDQKARAIVEVASGGEKSRVMLAIKSIIGNKRDINSMVFDEIDTGISGEVALKTGELLFDIGKNNQVISITHLPQVASKGDHHFKVSKSIVDGRTNVKMDKLDSSSRIGEIAEMLGGKEFSTSARKTAKELLN